MPRVRETSRRYRKRPSGCAPTMSRMFIVVILALLPIPANASASQSCRTNPPTRITGWVGELASELTPEVRENEEVGNPKYGGTPIGGVRVSGISCTAAGASALGKYGPDQSHDFLYTGIVAGMDQWPVPRKVTVETPHPLTSTLPIRYEHWTCHGTETNYVGGLALGYHVVCYRGRATVTASLAT